MSELKKVIKEIKPDINSAIFEIKRLEGEIVDLKKENNVLKVNNASYKGIIVIKEKENERLKNGIDMVIVNCADGGELNEMLSQLDDLLKDS